MRGKQGRLGGEDASYFLWTDQGKSPVDACLFFSDLDITLRSDAFLLSPPLPFPRVLAFCHT